MLHPSALFRATIVPSRQFLQQTNPSASSSSILLLSRRYLSTPATPTPRETTTSQPLPPQPSQQSQPRPFRVSRTPGNNFAVYQLAKRGGNKKLTTIKKIEGDRKAFKERLAEALGVDLKKIAINSLTGHVVVEGHRRTEISEWLAKQGF
ncbi:hypothetical protein MMYC01_210201 [Madurella mycetomatis]|uniref:Large ribosomal subunit protein mL49 n=1 Tax=Madurella mycetomatis TaxID=100816 RepID=A0A175VQL2_9PEZI|nr:hypothetical protein MMYC01_210201 [Madurella mycetomatis]